MFLRFLKTGITITTTMGAVLTIIFDPVQIAEVVEISAHLLTVEGTMDLTKTSATLITVARFIEEVIIETQTIMVAAVIIETVIGTMNGKTTTGHPMIVGKEIGTEVEGEVVEIIIVTIETKVSLKQTYLDVYRKCSNRRLYLIYGISDNISLPSTSLLTEIW